MKHTLFAYWFILSASYGLANTLYVDSNTVFHVDETLDAQSLILREGSTLSGFGTIVAPTTVYGSVTPAAGDVQTMRFVGPLSFVAGSTYGCFVDIDTNVSQLVVNGIVSGVCSVIVDQAAVDTTLYRAVIVDGLVNSDYSGFSIVGTTTNEWELDPIPIGDLALTEDGIDQDEDGVPDSWETNYGYDPLDPNDTSNDIDGDSQSAFEEYVLGTDPTDDQSYFYINNIQVIPSTNTSHEVMFDSVRHRTYTLQYVSADSSGAWVDSASPSVAGDNNPQSIEYTPDSNSVFYLRVHVEKD